MPLINHKKKRAAAHFRENPRFFANLGASPEFSLISTRRSRPAFSPLNPRAGPLNGGSGTTGGLAASGSGAGNGIRTRDTKLGKLVLYQLSYARTSLFLANFPGLVKAIFRHKRPVQ